ncbi:cyclic nucleotide-binding domain-containing protein [uncultured Sphaerochaeta sp.]|uniref:Crp/Fnr family transcriptional regulator n=1 Tax=uncultured Sphaerochaeta sp. TaxID=886478 RepID=UPI002A0A166B|nr:cyclic nucleotide-binding domain-containing protein [uncultured Sphaerochaeta sp.]
MVEDENIRVLTGSRLFKGLSQYEIEQVFDFIHPKEKDYDKNEIIVNQGEPVSKIGLLKKGTVTSIKYHFNGDAQILRIYKSGEVLSMDAVNTTFLTSPVTLLSQTDCSILFIAYKKLLEIDKISSTVERKNYAEQHRNIRQRTGSTDV